VHTRLLILGDRHSLAEALTLQLAAAGAEATTVLGEGDTELAATLAQTEWTAVAVLTYGDALALRLTLLAAHVRPDLPVWVTLFDRTIVHQFSEILPAVHVISTAELVADELSQRCMPFVTHTHLKWRAGVRIVDDALRLMVLTGAALVAILVIQTVLTMVALHNGFIDALYFSTRSVATVADTPNTAGAADWFKLVSTVVTVLALILVAVFTAALVRRLSRPRLTTLFGRQRAVARHHVLLVGFGQIGFRLAQRLTSQGVPVIALERDIDAPSVRLARAAGIPVLIGRGDDRATLELVGVRRCAAVAAVTSEDLTNVSVGLAASDVRPGIPLVLILGDGNVAAETESLLHLGQVLDAYDLLARHITAAMIESEAGVDGAAS
jgi:voltage-gated potassium channel Kch